MKTLLHPTYFPNIATFAVIAQNDIQWEVEDNYQKQTYRNRCYICTDFGKHILSIPIQHAGGDQGRQKYKEVLLDNSYSWQRNHWRTLQTAYRTSPFFEFYEDDIAPLYEQTYERLLDFNLKTIETLCECLQIDMPIAKTSHYQDIRTSDHKSAMPVIRPETTLDARFLVSAKRKHSMRQEKYAQVFGDRHGFVENTSILDLLFNEGTNALAYLQNQSTNFLNV